MIGEAPTNCTALRWPSIAADRIESAPAQTKSMRSTPLMSIGDDRLPSARIRRAARAAFGTAPASTPVPRRASPVRRRRAPLRSRPMHACATARRIALVALQRGGGSHEGGESSNVTANSTARSSNAACSWCHCRSSSDKQPRAFAAVPALLAPRVEQRPRASPAAGSRSSIRWRARAPSAVASMRAPASSNPVTDARSIRARGTHFSSARFKPSSCAALPLDSLPVTRDVAARRRACRRSAARHAHPTPAPSARTARHSASRTDRTPSRSLARCMQVEQREPRERRELGVVVGPARPAPSSARAFWSWPFAKSSAAFSSTAQKPGLACATSIAFGAVDQSMMLAPPQARLAQRFESSGLAARLAVGDLRGELAGRHDARRPFRAARRGLRDLGLLGRRFSKNRHRAYVMPLECVGRLSSRRLPRTRQPATGSLGARTDDAMTTADRAAMDERVSRRRDSVAPLARRQRRQARARFSAAKSQFSSLSITALT